MLVFDQLSDSSRFSGAFYDPVSDDWTPVAANSVMAQESPVVLAGGGILVLDELGGSGGILSARSNDWCSVSFGGATFGNLSLPATRAVWNGQRVLVWDSMNGYGGMYSVADDAWSSILTLHAVVGRYGAAATWSGDRLMVWGGYDGAQGPTYPGYLDSGASFDPATNRWASVSAVGAPAGRDTHLMVSDGSRVFVFGGYNLAGCETTGGIYDPSSDTWTRMLSAGAPCLRSGSFFNSALAFWADGRVVVLDSPDKIYSYVPE
jgi:hypothetical protein